jgi:hypothetical protein
MARLDIYWRFVNMGPAVIVIQVLFILISPLLHAALGQRVYAWMLLLCPAPQRAAANRLEPPCALALGMLLHLVCIFFLKCLGLWWSAAVFLPLLPICLAPPRWREFLGGLAVRLSLNFVLWFFAALALGVSLFQVIEGIQTPWTNNYGDLAYHMGMITSFAFGNNFPPQYHLFPPETLSYPFLVNLWSASLWWPAPSFRMLAFIFTFQWVVLWCLVYYFLRGNRYWLLPWALLLGGGSYFAFQNYSWELLSKGFPWAVFFTTIWVTQRAALFGAAVVLCALWNFYAAMEETPSGPEGACPPRLALAGLLLGLAPLAHGHLWLVTTAFVGLVLTARLCLALWVYMRGARARSVCEICSPNRALVHIGVFLLALLPCCLFLPWLLGKSGMMAIMYGWLVREPSPGSSWGDVSQSLLMWARNAPAWLLLISIYWMLTLRHMQSGVLLLLFVLGNIFKLAYWDWDQLKVFLGIYLIFLAMWSRLRDSAAWRFHLLFVLLTVPAGYELFKLFQKGEIFTVYSQEAMTQAAVVRSETPPDAIIAAAPDHNSLVTLAGRKLYMGYLGTLWSHGIDYGARERRMKDLPALCACAAVEREKDPTFVCPGYLLWTEAERRYWQSAQVPACAVRAGADFLYRLPGG